MRIEIQALVLHIVMNTHDEVGDFFAGKIVKYRLDHCGGKFFGTKSVASAQYQRVGGKTAVSLRFGNCGADIFV